MKVLQINSVSGIRSTGRICTDIKDILSAQGHTCKIAYGRYNAPQKYQDCSVKIATEKDWIIQKVQSMVLDNAGFGNRKNTARFLQWVREYSPDLIHLHNLHGYYINVEMLFNFLHETSLPVVWTLHDCWSFTGHCTHFDVVHCEKWKTECHACPIPKTYPHSYVCNCSKRNYARKKRLFTALPNMTIVTPSKWLADCVNHSFLAHYPVKVIPNGIDLKAFSPIQNDFKKQHQIEDKFMVLGVSVLWNELKGLTDFIKLSTMLGASYKIVLVGVPTDIQKTLPKNILALNKTDSIASLAQIYSVADVFVNPTYEDTFPTTNLEALACGTPVITYQTGGSPESVDPSCGAVVKKGDVHALHQAILDWTTTKNPLQAKNCRQKSLQFDKNDRFLEYTALYQSVVR